MKAEILSPILTLLLTAAILYFVPLFTRPGIYFGATVSTEFSRSAEGRNLLRSFRLQVSVWTVLAVCLALLTASSSPWLAVLLPRLLLLACSGFSYWSKFREVHEHYGVRKPEIREADLAPAQTGSELNPWLVVPPFLALAAVALYVRLHWNQFPQHFPVHGIRGQTGHWANRGGLSIYGPILYGAYLNLFLFAMGWALSHETRKTVMRHVTVQFLQFMCYPLTLTFAVIAVLPLLRPRAASALLGLMPLVILAMVAGAIYWSYRKLSAPSDIPETVGPQRDDYWKAGAFYWNPDDPAILVPKRVGIGYTLNFANKWSWIALATILLAALLPVFLFAGKG